MRIYELLGSPTVVFRHKPSHEDHLSGPRSRWHPERFHDTKSWQMRLRTNNRVRTRCFYEVDQSYRKELEEQCQLPNPRRRKIRTESQNETSIDPVVVEDINVDDDDHCNDKFWNNAQFLDTRMRPSLLDARMELLASDPDRKMLLTRYKLLDHPYIPDQKAHGSRPVMMGPFHVDRWKASRDFAIERRHANLSYLAPFTACALLECNDQSREKDQWTGPQITPAQSCSTDESNSVIYGNCLVCLQCPCCQNSWFLIHRTGVNLSRVCISNLSRPNQIQTRSTTKLELYSIDVNNKILQISECGSNHVVVRTIVTVTLFLITNNVSNDGSDGSCTGFTLKIVSKVNLGSNNSYESLGSLATACHPQYGNDLVSAKFAVLSRSRETTRSYIHHLFGNGRPIEHLIGNLRNIDLIDFSCSHPMTLWSAATSFVRPTLVEDHCTSRLAFGHGSSLFSVDLRSDKATFQWSPSRAEYVTEGVHSISGILTDWSRVNTVWVSSSSAGKMWELDARMPCREVTRWSIPGLVQDRNTVIPTSGLHGSGTIMTRPSSQYYESKSAVVQPVLCIDKSSGPGNIDLYQKPESGPRFQTASVETSVTPGLSSSPHAYSSIAQSSVFPLVDSSQNAFTCGIVCFRTHISDFLNDTQISGLGFSTDPSEVLCTITTNSLGDIYAHTILECNNGERRKSLIRRDLPLGSSVLLVPELEYSESVCSIAGDLWVTLSNKVTPAIDTQLSVVSTRSNCRQFSTVHREKLRWQCAERQLLEEPDTLTTLTHPGNMSVTNAKHCFDGTKRVKLGSSLIDEAFFYFDELADERNIPTLEQEERHSDLHASHLKNLEEKWNMLAHASNEETSNNTSPTPSIYR